MVFHDTFLIVCRNERVGSASDAGEAIKPADGPLQRRKRISTLPNLAKPRVTALTAQRLVSKPAQKQVPQSVSGNTSRKESSASDKTNSESSPKSPNLPEKKTPVPQVPQFSPLKKSRSKEPNASIIAHKNDETLQKSTLSPLKERPTQGRSKEDEMSHAKSTPAKEKKRCSDRERILKAQKLREMLKEELRKEKLKHGKSRQKVAEGFTAADRSKMTMRDLIYFLPQNNPMKSSLIDEKTSASSQMKESEEKSAPVHEDEEEVAQAEDEEENHDDKLLVPRVKVAEDGSIILDEESLTVEVLRTKGPSVVEDNDPIFERGSTTTYSSFRKSFYTKPWSNKETDMFFLAISMVGTDFSLIGQLFPHRARSEIKNKFKREEKTNGWRIDKAFKEKRPFDFEFFAQLLGKVLADEEKRKQKVIRSQRSKEKKPQKARKKQKVAHAENEKAANEQDQEDVGISDAETEVDAVTAEKENEESLNVSEPAEGQLLSEPGVTKKKRKQKKRNSEKELQKLADAETGVDAVTAERDNEETVNISEPVDEQIASELVVPKKKRKQKKKNLEKELENLSDVETGVNTLIAEKENEDSLNPSELTEEQITSEPMVKRKRKEKKKNSDQGMETLAKETAVILKPAKGEKSSRKQKNTSGTNSDDSTECREELGIHNEEMFCETPVQVEQVFDSSLQLNDENEEDSDFDLHSFQDSNNVTEAEPVEPEITSESQEWQLSKSQVLVNRNQGSSDQTTESKNNEVFDLCEPGDKESAAGRGCDTKSETMESEKAVAGKSGVRGRLQRPKPNLARGSGKREGAVQEKSEVRAPPPELMEGAEKDSVDDSEGKMLEVARDETTGRENKDSETEAQETEKVVTGRTAVRGRQQRFKPNLVGASGKKNEPLQAEREDKTLHSETDGKTEEKNSNQGNKSDVPRVETTKKDGRVSGTESQSEETAQSQEDGKQSVLKPAPLMRSRMQRPKPNVERAAVRQGTLILQTDLGKAKTDCGEAVEKDLIHCEDKTGGSLLTASDAIQAHLEVLEKEAAANPEKLASTHENPHSLKESLESESCEQVKTIPGGDLKTGSDSDTGDSGSQKQERKDKPAQLLRGQFQRPKPNLGRSAGKREVSGADKDVSDDNTDKEEKSLQSDCECSLLPDLDKTAKCDVLPLGKNDLADSREVSVIPLVNQSPKKLSGSESDEPSRSSPPADNEEIAAPVAVGLYNKNIPQEQSKPSSLQPAQLVRGRFQRPRPNIGRGVGRKETRPMEKNESEVEQSIQHKHESSSSSLTTVKGENEVICSEPSEKLLDCEKQTEQEESQVPSILQNVSNEQSSIKKSSSLENKPGAIRPAQLMRHRFRGTRPSIRRLSSKTGELSAEKNTAPVEREAGQMEASLLEHEDCSVSFSTKAEVETLTVLEDLSRKDDPDFSAVTSSPKKIIRSEEVSSSEKSLKCNSQRNEVGCVSTEVVESLPDNSEGSSDKFTSEEESKPSKREPSQLRKGHLQRPKPNLVKATRRREVPDEGESTTEDKCDAGNADEDLILCGSSKSEKLNVLVHGSAKLADAASPSEVSRKNISEELTHKRSRQFRKFQSLERSSESESQIEQDDSQPSAAEEKTSDKLTRRRRRSSKQIALPKRISELRAATSFSSEFEADHSEKGKWCRKFKPNVTRGRGSKPARSKKSGKDHRSSKVTLVTLRASQEEDEDEADDFEPDDEDECFAPEEVNKAPVFVPVGLRSPKPVPVQIEETMEELEISVNVPDVPCVTTAESVSPDLNVPVQAGIQSSENSNIIQIVGVTTYENPETDTGANDGSTEAAMTLLAMGDPMFQLKISAQGRTQVLPEQDERDVADSFVNQPYAEHSAVLSEHSLPSPAANNKLVPLEDGNKIILEDQSTGTGIGGEDYANENAGHSSDHSVPKACNTRLTRCLLPRPKPNVGILERNGDACQKSYSPEIVVEQLVQVESEDKTLSDSAEEEVVEQKIRSSENSPSSPDDTAARSTDLVKQGDKDERTEKEMRETWEALGEVKALITSPETESCQPGLGNDPGQSFTFGFREGTSCDAENNLYAVELLQTEASAHKLDHQSLTSSKETSAVSGCDNEYQPDLEEQTFILTLVEIPTDSKEYSDGSVSLGHTSEPLLPAPIILSPVNTDGAKTVGKQSIGSLTPIVGEVLAPSLDNCTEIEGPQRTLTEPFLNLESTPRKRRATDTEDSNVPPAKRSPATSTEDKLESSVKSIHAPTEVAGKLLENLRSLKKKNVSTSASLSTSADWQLEQGGQHKSLQNVETLPLEDKSACKYLNEGGSGICPEIKIGASEQGLSVEVHEPEQSGHAGTIAAPSKTLLVRPGRKPLGFLSLICKKSSPDVGEDSKGNKEKFQKPQIPASKRSLKRSAPSTEDKRQTLEPCSLPSTSTSFAEGENTAATVVKTSCDKTSEKPAYPKEQEKEEAPTSISEYFFSDIFMEVDDPE
ncbi:PREDICTED: transcription factor TFIIIB component B'' homolog isoform X2 [Gavialis gangeticus]|uniref:transcription factor TFIIIB component B'' homolog isoform X2 n=1 Tax=Gavialis gangeticus TaxID=94835 RepID=UPI00092F7083|nr:PREDICTED: transcription factor TFIIIB component B'' homolog isoform X2 [Gavialis gangeticus]